jgi:DNA helicase-2/ATP-dependent DNA helicase PcrA
MRALRSGEPAHLEEQRRLLYVGLTRAMDRLTLTCALRRPGRESTPSRFWEELSLRPQEPAPADAVPA